MLKGKKNKVLELCICPECGSRRVHIVENRDSSTYQVVCFKCHKRGDKKRSMVGAIKEWNKKACTEGPKVLRNKAY